MSSKLYSLEYKVVITKAASFHNQQSDIRLNEDSDEPSHAPNIGIDTTTLAFGVSDKVKL